MSEADFTPEVFTLDLDYVDFVPGKTRLKFQSVVACSLSDLIFRLVTASLLCLVLLGYITMTVPEFLHDFMLQHFSSETQAVVTDCQMSRTNEFGYIPEITYRYTINGYNVSQLDGLLSYSSGDCTQYPSGTTMTLLYIAPDPSIARLKLAYTMRPLLFELMISVAMVLGMGFLSLLTGFAVKVTLDYPLSCAAYLRLRRQGFLLEGRIIRTMPVTQMPGNIPCTGIEYQFTTPAKRQVKSEITVPVASIGDRLQPAVDVPVTILYADDNAYVML